MDRKKNKIINKKAIALNYKKDEIAPKLVSKGKGKDAKKIIDMANENSIPVITDSNLTDTIYQLEINDYIPQELYEIIAAIYSYVMKKREIKNEEEN